MSEPWSEEPFSKASIPWMAPDPSKGASLHRPGPHSLTEAGILFSRCKVIRHRPEDSWPPGPRYRVQSAGSDSPSLTRESETIPKLQVCPGQGNLWHGVQGRDGGVLRSYSWQAPTNHICAQSGGMQAVELRSQRTVAIKTVNS